jgi:hypothetical protein
VPGCNNRVSGRSRETSVKPYPLTWEEQRRLFQQLPGHDGPLRATTTGLGTGWEENRRAHAPSVTTSAATAATECSDDLPHRSGRRETRSSECCSNGNSSKALTGRGG